MAFWEWGLVMLPFLGLALVALYVGYVAYETEQQRKRLAAEPPMPDYAEEMARINTEMSRHAAQARKLLEQARDAVQRGTR